MQKCRRTLLFLSLGSLAFLSGCDSEIFLPVKYSECAGPALVKTAALTVEVGACRDPQTGLESNSLLKARQQIAFIFPEVAFGGCREVEFKSLADFQVPVVVGGAGDAAPGEDDIALGFQGQGLYFLVGSGIRGRMARLGQSVSSMGAFETENFHIRLSYQNDSGADQSMTVPGMFLEADGKEIPFHFEDIVWEKGGREIFRLPNTASAAALSEGDEYGRVLVFRLNEREDEPKAETGKTENAQWF